MPSHKIHLAISNEINKKLKLDNDLIMLGSVLPDLTIDKKHYISHYQVDGSYEDRLANPDKFIKEYKNKLDNPIMIGYLIHILTDRYYNDYFYKKHTVNIDGTSMVKFRNGKLKKSNKWYKKKEFGKYDKWLLKHNYVVPFIDMKCIDKVFNLSCASFNKEYLKEYIEQSNREILKPNLYKIKSTFFYHILSKKELDEMYNECIKYIFDYINKNILELSNKL